jgi:hypothetical protein
MIRITTPYFCAGGVVCNGVVIDAAPIIKWMIGKTIADLHRYCERKKGYRLEVLE